MDWTLAIDMNRKALLRLLAVLFAMAGGGAVAVLPRHVRGAVLLILRPAESAVRRLIVIVGRDLVLAPRQPHPCPARIPRGDGERAPVFPLLDSLKRFEDAPRPPAGAGPRIWIPGIDDPVFVSREPASPDDPVSAVRLCRRLRALQSALDDLPRQARRFARWRARRERPRRRPFRPGRLPGHRKRRFHEVDDILKDCHSLALHALEPP